MLTTITPYWGRPKMLEIWIKALREARHPEVQHLVLVVGDPIPRMSVPPRFQFIGCEGFNREPIQSIGYFHNMGARLANSEWIMKLDVDALPNEQYFHALMPILHQAREREWFNGGMFHISQSGSHNLLNSLLRMPAYYEIIHHTRFYCQTSYPVSTNFICRKEDYLKLGGCDPRFAGWGWEDYQQIYMLEQYQLGSDPLPGPVDLANITNRCRDEISRPKVLQLYRRNDKLALLHHWYPVSRQPGYRSPKIIERNRGVLLGYVQEARKNITANQI